MDGYEAEIENEIEQGVIHGAVIQAGTLFDIVVEQAWGLAVVAPPVPMRVDTVIDIASVTKVVATTTALAVCRSEGLLDFDAPFTTYLPEYTAPLPEPITVRELAMHVSGFGRQSSYDAPTGPELRRRMQAVPPPKPRGRIEYSCWNYQLLGLVVENITGQTLGDFCRERIFLPLEMHGTSLGQPAVDDPWRLAQTCGTEKPGQVSDFVAYRLYRDGLTAGNAGVFSMASDLAKFCRCMLRGGEYGNGRRLFSPETFAAMSEPRAEDGLVRRSFGWIVADEFKPEGFSEHTIYHSGWSGQTIFIDLERQFYAVVLTTRVLNEYDRSKLGRFSIIADLGRAVLDN